MSQVPRELLELASALACELSTGQADALASELELSDRPRRIRHIGGLPVPLAVNELCECWIRSSEVDGRTLGAAIRCAARAVSRESSYERVELIFTGPGSASIRLTKQALLEVVRGAQRNLWVVSYVFGAGADDVIEAFQERAMAGVDVKLLYDHRIDNANQGLARLRRDAPGCKVFVWPDEKREISTGKYANLHAKCAVADGRQAFVSSANLTGWAMDHNLEVGYLVTGGESPKALQRFLDGLVEQGVAIPG